MGNVRTETTLSDNDASPANGFEPAGPVPTVDLANLKRFVSALDAATPIHTLVVSLPQRMPSAEYAALVPTLWALTERS